MGYSSLWAELWRRGAEWRIQAVGGVRDMLEEEVDKNTTKPQNILTHGDKKREDVKDKDN